MEKLKYLVVIYSAVSHKYHTTDEFKKSVIVVSSLHFLKKL